MKRPFLIGLACLYLVGCDKEDKGNDTYPSVRGFWVSECRPIEREGEQAYYISVLEITDTIIIRTENKYKNDACKPLVEGVNHILKFDKLDKSNGDNWVGSIFEGGKEVQYIMNRYLVGPSQEEHLGTHFTGGHLSAETWIKFEPFDYKRLR